jgi:hypothetical protein
MAIKRVTISMKHNDLVVMCLDDENGREVFDHDGYMPQVGMFSCDDQTEIIIDNETGKIIGWKPITEEEIQELNGKDEEELGRRFNE